MHSAWRCSRPPKHNGRVQNDARGTPPSRHRLVQPSLFYARKLQLRAAIELLPRSSRPCRIDQLIAAVCPTKEFLLDRE